MKNCMNVYRWLISVWILCSGCYTASAAFGYEQGAQSGSWTNSQAYGSQSSSAFRSTSATGYSSVGSLNTVNTTFSDDVYPDYSFRSTSSYTPVDNAPAYSAPQNAPRKSGWGRPTDNPVGQVTNPVPVGEPLILLLMAGLYLALSILMRRRACA